jgi:UDP-N-acetylmuramoyl-tripeptide--D-alanyl-D-alanine ligase
MFRMEIPYLFSLAAVLFYAAVRLRRELQMMQQNSYRTGRYLKWLKGDLAGVDRVTDLLILAVLVGFTSGRWGFYAILAVGLLALYKGVRELTGKYKKPLVFTPRARRIYLVALALMMGTVAAVWKWLFAGWLIEVSMGLALLTPVLICLAVWMLSPVELAINNWYIRDARRILRSTPRLIVVGITGSYGKTSTKHYLHRILSERFSVVMTPGSYNTTLGVVRTVREHLKPYTEVFIVEMGAKQPGDIAEICEIVHPSIGIITAVGEQHLESFKTLENVGRTKFELVDSLPPDGVAILGDDSEYTASRRVTNVKKVFRYTSRQTGEGPGRIGDVAVSAKNADRSEYLAELCTAGMELDPNGSATPPEADRSLRNYGITDVKYGPDGTSFAIETPEGKTEPLTTRLVGIHNLSNILAACIAAGELGMTFSEIRYAVSQIEQVEHRLAIKRGAGGVTIIDDAFNSNPRGAAMALDVLAGFTGGTRIVVTPGMVELGARGYHHNRELGRRMASSSDIAVVVGEHNREAILEGFADGKAGLAEENAESADKITIVALPDFAAASRYVQSVVRPGDTVLYENDLPDTFK